MVYLAIIFFFKPNEANSIAESSFSDDDDVK
jgi:hypothetical protein